MTLAPAVSPALGGTERGAGEERPVAWEDVQVGDVVEATGTVGMYGTEPHIYLALEVEDASMADGLRLLQVAGEHEDALARLQGRKVTITGTVERLEMGPGFPLMVEVETWQVTEER